MKKLFLILILSGVLSGRTPAEVCKILTVEGVIDPVIAKYVGEELKKNDFDIAMISLNTPGGLMDSMQDIVKAMMNCPKPVCVWIGPTGSRAASAGVFITVAADFAAMAPATNIGAAHPVQMGIGKEGKENGVMMEKVVNDAVAYIQGIAREKGRPLDWVANAVRKSVSIDAEEAVKKGIVDFIVSSPREFLNKIDGREIRKGDRDIVVRTKNAEIVWSSLSMLRDFLHKLANPNIAFILMIIGVWGIIQEASSPGIGFGGVIGGISLLLAFFSMRVLPINTVGVLLLILGAVLLFLEVFTPTFGILTVGGIVSIFLGGIMLIDKTRMDIGISWGVLIPSLVGIAFFMFFVVAAIIRSQKRKAVTGVEGMIGEEGIAKEAIKETGSVFVHGEIWRATSSREIPEGAPVVVKKVKGNVLEVEEKTDG
ncbi:MAG: nodulation protein NfeD [Elusimicrobia bacterium]|nr:nodulation protein NfeD [Elusimicrobiota bacterium]